MTTTIQVSRGLCSPMRDDVLTALEPRGVKIFDFDCWGEGHHHLPVPPGVRMPDADIWVRRHIARVTVSDKQAAWVERLLWQTNRMELDRVWRTDNPVVSIGPLNRNLEWTAPADCKVGEHGTLGRGKMPTPWSENKRQPRQRRQRQTRRTRQARKSDGWISKLLGGEL